MAKFAILTKLALSVLLEVPTTLRMSKGAFPNFTFDIFMFSETCFPKFAKSKFVEITDSLVSGHFGKIFLKQLVSFFFGSTI
jgi:hypothetical protein